MRIQIKAKRVADKYLRDEEKRTGYKPTGMHAYTIWMIEYSDYIERAGYKFDHGQVVLR